LLKVCSKVSEPSALKFPYCCFNKFFFVFLVASLPPNVFRIAAYNSCAVLYLLNCNWCSSGRANSKVVLAFISFFLFCMSLVVNATVLSFFVAVPPLANPVAALVVYESEVQKKSKSNSQNMAFISSAKNSNGKEDVNTTSIPTASTNVSPTSVNIGAKKTGKKISIQGTDVVGFDKLKVECFNCHKMGHFARECRAPRSQDMGRRDNYRQGSKVEEQAPKALMAIDRVGWDRSIMKNEKEDYALVADEEALTKFTLMAKTSAESKVKGRLVEFKNQKIKFCEKIRVLEFKVESKTDRIKYLTNELEMLKKEKGDLDYKLTGFQTASKDLAKLLESQRSDKNKEGPSPTIESNSDDLQNKNPSVTETGASSSTILSKPANNFAKAAKRPT
nr:hypothetical protein [Tanacetum cinerariifolium]